jgi:tRNA uridine 5-carboxymethylaminomethyl modification enzyme
MIKFEGYIKKQDKYIDKFKKWEKIDISSIRDYSVIENLSLEARDKLNKIKPQTLGQAERIQGINMPDLIVVKFYLEQQKNDE